MKIVTCEHCGSIHRDDDQIAVTEEWLRSVSAADGHGCWIWPDKDGDQCYPLLLLERLSDCWSATICGDDWPNDIRTRGDVRRLCAALGIELQEANPNER